MKKAGLKMSLLMGGSMSAALSLTGLVSSGHFTVPWFIRIVFGNVKPDTERTS